MFKRNTYHLSPVFIIAAPSHSDFDKPNTGDIDYARTLATHIQSHYKKNVTLITQAGSSQSIFQQIWRNSDSNKPILHLLLNPSAPFTGCMITPLELAAFKNKGGKVVISMIEFAKYDEWGPEGKEPQIKALSYLDNADEIIFLDEYDKKSACNQANLKWLKKLNHAKVISVPATIPINTQPLHRHGKDIMSFGMIRKGKGLDTVVLKLAELLANKVSNKKIHIVGTVSTAQIDQSDTTLATILMRLYPTYTQEILSKSPVELVDLYHAKLNEITPALPIELHLNVESTSLPELFGSCTYSVLPAFRGATLRNSSISSSLTNHLITYTHETSITPDCLRQNGAYNAALVLIQNNNNPEKYAEEILQDIENREQRKNANDVILDAMKKLVKNKISTDAIAKQHCELYRKLNHPTHSSTLHGKNFFRSKPAEMNIVLLHATDLSCK